MKRGKEGNVTPNEMRRAKLKEKLSVKRETIVGRKTCTVIGMLVATRFIHIWIKLYIQLMELQNEE
jgi:hypothetical protein